jgi:hypothetical protein
MPFISGNIIAYMHLSKHEWLKSIWKALVNTAGGASWVSLHHGGSEGMD